MILLTFQEGLLMGKKGHACPLFEECKQSLKPYFKPKIKKHNW